MIYKKLPKVSVIIPLYNEEKYIAACLDSITKQTYPRALTEIIVVDNQSTDNSMAIAESFDVKVICSFAAYVGQVRNDGARVANGDVLIFLDSDCCAPENWIENGINLLKQSASSVIGGRYSLRALPSFFEKYWVLPEPIDSSIQSDLIGGCIFIEREIFETVGGFSEVLTAGEDSQLSKDLDGLAEFRVTTELNVVHLGYPHNLRGFFSRQVWQSSSYVQDITVSMREPMFLFGLINCFVVMLIAVFTVFGAESLALCSLLVMLALPFTLSIKRVIKTQCYIFGLRHCFPIYVIDFLYLHARSYGIAISMVRRLLGLTQIKSRK